MISYGDNAINSSGEMLITLCTQMSLRIQNCFYKHQDIYIFTWVQTICQLKSLTDYVIWKQVKVEDKGFPGSP